MPNKPLLLSIILFAASFNAFSNPITINGFITQNINYLDDDITYQAAVTDQVDFNYGSHAGLQVNYQYNEKVDTTLQLVSQIGEQFELKMESAFLRYRINEYFNFKAGKVRTPIIFLQSRQKKSPRPVQAQLAMWYLA